MSIPFTYEDLCRMAKHNNLSLLYIQRNYRSTLDGEMEALMDNERKLRASINPHTLEPLYSPPYVLEGQEIGFVAREFKIMDRYSKDGLLDQETEIAHQELREVLERVKAFRFA